MWRSSSPARSPRRFRALLGKSCCNAILSAARLGAARCSSCPTRTPALPTSCAPSSRTTLGCCGCASSKTPIIPQPARTTKAERRWPISRRRRVRSTVGGSTNARARSLRSTSTSSRLASFATGQRCFREARKTSWPCKGAPPRSSKSVSSPLWACMSTAQSPPSGASASLTSPASASASSCRSISPTSPRKGTMAPSQPPPSGSSASCSNTRRGSARFAPL
mmetsp:Transcript_266/g.579  ORF Transcript_266/g.579 Transcript_266/m.579 type:complete len:222 (+) Transcript_266:2721-3386(+)